MKRDPITAATVRILNERADALPVSMYGSRQRFLEEAARLARASDEQIRKILAGVTPTLRLDLLYGIAGALGEDALVILREAEAAVLAAGDWPAPSVAEVPPKEVGFAEQADGLSGLLGAQRKPQDGEAGNPRQRGLRGL